MHEARWVAGVLGEGAGGVAAIRGEGGAEEGFVACAVEARVAGEEGVGGYGVVEGERGDVGAEGGDGAGCFVTFLEMGGQLCGRKGGGGGGVPGMSGHCLGRQIHIKLEGI